MKLKTFYKNNFSWKLSISALLLALLMLTASRWQWIRYLEKTEQVNELRSYSVQEAIPFAEFISSLKENTQDSFSIDKIPQYTKILIRGEYDLENQSIIINRRHKLGSGSWLFTPLKITSDEIDETTNNESLNSIMVNRGFIPFEDRDPSSWTKYDEVGEVEVLAMVAPTIGKRSSLSPSAKIKIDRQWLYPDLTLMQEELPYPINTSFYLQKMAPPFVGNFPAEDIRIDVPPSTHFWYTFEWIALAFLTCLISLMIQIFRPKNRYDTHNTRPE